MKLGLAVLVASSSMSCLVDLDQPCGDGFVEREDGSCVCPADQVAEDGRCVSCGKHEEANAGVCVCESGYELSGGKCVKVAGDDAEAADAGSAGGVSDSVACDAGDCDEQSTTDATPCESSMECADDELCDVHDTQQCLPKPDGLGQGCASDADCAGTMATYCEIFSSSTCQVEGCADEDGVCPGDMACCDFAILGRSLCIPADRLEMGQCPVPGELVERGQP